LSLHDIYNNIGVDENLSRRPEFPSTEGLYCLTWLAYAGVCVDGSHLFVGRPPLDHPMLINDVLRFLTTVFTQVTRNMFTLVPTVNKPLFDAVQAARIAAVGDSKIGGWYDIHLKSSSKFGFVC